MTTDHRNQAALTGLWIRTRYGSGIAVSSDWAPQYGDWQLTIESPDDGRRPLCVLQSEVLEARLAR